MKKINEITFKPEEASIIANEIENMYRQGALDILQNLQTFLNELLLKTGESKKVLSNSIFSQLKKEENTVNN